MHHCDRSSSLATSIRRVLGVATLTLAVFTAHAQSALEAVHRFEIPAQNTSDALNEFSKQSGLRLLFSYEALEGRAAPTINGDYTPQQVLDKLLSGTDLKYEIADGVVVVRDQKQRFERTSLRSGDASDASLRIAQAVAKEEVGGAPGAGDDSAPSGEESAARGGRVQLEEVLVTGSHIRGADNQSSPILRFDRGDIERSGHATLQEFIKSLPQNLGNVSDSATGGINGGPLLNEGYLGSGLNLRGLGSDSTLVLLNGRRLAAAGNGSFVDVSLIPLSAIERIDVLTDGASAIYGSDAVGGVVNMILRRDFEGSETRLRYGTVTQGSHDELQAGQLFGHSWESGQALLSYEYHESTNLDAADREFFRPEGGYRGLDLIPEQARHGALAVLSQQMTDQLELSSTVFFGKRHSGIASDSGVPLYARSEVEQYGGSLGLSWEMSNQWQIQLSGMFDRNEGQYQTFLLPSRVQIGPTPNNASDLWSVDIGAEGSIGQLPGGEFRLAIGGQYRDEQFVEGLTQYPGRFQRNIAAVYAEVLLPWVGKQNRRQGVERFEMTLAGRYEEYSDFGETFNPKIGLAWAPIEGLNVRGTWGTSFKAPLFNQMNPANLGAVTYEGLFQDTDGMRTGLYLYGSGVGLGPEESTNWTAGIDFTPAAAPELSIAATYFNIEYRERVRTPLPRNYNPFAVALDSAFAPIVTRDPNPALIAALLSRASIAYCYTSQFEECPSMIPADQITLLLDTRLRNLAGVRMSGIDFSASYRLDSAIGEWGLQLNAQRLLKNTEQLIRGVAATNVMNDVYRPADLRVRGNITLSRGALSATTAVNYTDGYEDRRSSYAAGPLQRPDVASWITVDLSLQYDLSKVAATSWLGQTTLNVGAINLFDRNPPFVASAFGLYFDGVNATPRGRFVSAQVTARW